MMTNIQIQFRAYKINGDYFNIAFGPRYDEPYVALKVQELASYIAVYWSRCKAMLELSNDNGKTWHKANDDKQKLFSALLDAEFHLYEW